MNPVTRDFVRRWNWLIVIQFAAMTFAWIMHEKGWKLHLEMLMAMAMSLDFMRGLIRASLGLPISRMHLSRGLWLAVVGIGPLATITGMIVATIFCKVSGMVPPSSGSITFHIVISVLVAGTMQFLLTNLPTRSCTTFLAKTRAFLFCLCWGLGMASPVMIAKIIPADWHALSTGGIFVIILLTILAIASYFTTRTMIIRRAMPQAMAPSAVVTGSENSMLRGASGWKLWLAMEMGWLAPISVMVLFVLGYMEVSAMLTSPGVAGAIRSGSNVSLSLGLMCAMFIQPLFEMAARPARALRALPISSNTYSLLLTCRPLIFSLGILFVAAATAMMTRRDNGWDGRIVCLFVLIGSLVSVMQATLVRYPHLPLVIGFAVFLAPACIVTVPFVLGSGMPVWWMVLVGIAFLSISWLLHRRWLRISSQYYRRPEWLARLGGGNVR